MPVGKKGREQVNDKPERVGETGTGEGMVCLQAVHLFGDRTNKCGVRGCFLATAGYVPPAPPPSTNIQGLQFVSPAHAG